MCDTNVKFKYGSVLKLTRYDTKESIEASFAKMRECGMNTVVVWPAAFYWEQKKEGYPFNTGKLVLELAQKYGIGVVMELAGQLTVFEYLPDWAMKKEYHPIKHNGEREFGQSSFGFLSYFNPEVNEKICDHYRSVATAYKDYPALIGYDIFNETMFRSFDEYTMDEFRVWLREKYGNINRLNEAWERTYSDWSEITYEAWAWMSIIPEADYAAFRKAAIGRFLGKWKSALVEVDSSHLVIADNIHSMVAPVCPYDRPQDDFDLKRVVGEIGMSFYPKQMSGTLDNAMRWEIFDAYYAASEREGFLISEMQTHIQSLFNYNTCVRTHELKRWCFEAYAAGANGLVYWMWRPFDSGLQILGRGLVDYKGEPTERFTLAKEIGKPMNSIGKLKPLKGKVGVLFDPLCDDFSRIIVKSYKIDDNIYLRSIFGAYKAMFDTDVSCDIVTIKDIESYKAIILTNNIVMDNTRAELLRKYVENGGTLIVDGRFGMLNTDAKLCEELPGGELNDLMGVSYSDSDYEGLQFDYCDEHIRGYLGRELVNVNSGDVLSCFDDGNPAVVRKCCGNGQVISFHTHIWYGYDKTGDASVKKVAQLLADELSLRSFDLEGEVKVRISEANGEYLLFVFNYSVEDQPVKIEFMGKTYELTVAANDSKIIRADGSVVI